MHGQTKEQNPFEVLGVGPDADDKAVKDAYKAASKACHPDRRPGDTKAADRFIAVKAAYERIKTAPQRRAAAVSFGMMMTAAPGAADLTAAFSGFYRSMDRDVVAWGKRYSNIPVRGGDIVKDVSVTLEQAYRGGVFRIDHPAARCGGCHGAGRIRKAGRHQCPTCAGERVVRSAQARAKVQIGCPTCAAIGSVNWVLCSGCGGVGQVPAISTSLEMSPGVVSGQQIVLAGLGGPGISGGAAGDLVVRVNVLEHPTFSRQGDDLLQRLTIWVWDAALGVTQAMKGIDGGIFECEIPPGCQPGSVLRIEDAGMPMADGGRGALLIAIDVRIPEAVEGAAREAFLRMRREFDVS